ncbi:hypothetical protein ACS0TY_032863 [Phlomoides rotata]
MIGNTALDILNDLDEIYLIVIIFKIDAESTTRKRMRLSMLEFFAFRIHERLGEANTIFYSKRLFQQFLVDCFTMIESKRMCYVRNNQATLRTDKWCDLKDAADRGKTETSTAGKKIIPSSYTGGPRYMIQNLQDVMSICKYYSYPNYL